MEASMNTVKVKSENWSGEEKAAMASAFLENFPVINGKFSSTVTGQAKTHAWEEVVKSITLLQAYLQYVCNIPTMPKKDTLKAIGGVDFTNVNSCSVTKRNISQVKKKWSEVKSAVKKKEAAIRQYARGTGGGPAPEPLCDWEMKVLQVIPNSIIEGIVNGGFESFKENKSQTNPNVQRSMPPVMPTSVVSDSENEEEEPDTENQPTKETEEPITISPPAMKKLKTKKATNSNVCTCTSSLLEITRQQLEVQKGILSVQQERLQEHRKTNQILQDILTNHSSTFFSATDLSISPIYHLQKE